MKRQSKSMAKSPKDSSRLADSKTPVIVGRPLSDVVTNLNYAESGNNERKAIQTLMFIEKEIIANDERWFKVRIMPYRTLKNMFDGVVITFIDMTQSKKIEAELRLISPAT